MAVGSPDALRLEYLERMKRVEEMLSACMLEEVDSQLRAARQLFNQRKAAVLQLGRGLQEHQRRDMRQGSYRALLWAQQPGRR